LASGTTINATLSHPLDAKKNKPGDPVTARTIEATRSYGRQVLPKGTVLVGHVSQAHPRSKAESASALAIVFDKAVLKDGSEVPLNVTIQALAAPAVGDSLPAGDQDLGLGGGRGGAASSHDAGRGALGGVGSAGSGAGGGPVGSAAGSAASAEGAAGGAVNSTADPSGTGNGPVGSAGNIAGGATGAARGLNSGLNSAGQLTANSQGVFGLGGITLTSAAMAGAEGSVITSAGKNVHLDSGTQLLHADGDGGQAIAPKGLTCVARAT
jgi:hypothetical protein